MMRWLFVLSIAAVALLAWSWQAQGWRPPDHWNPWAPVRIDAPVNWLTLHKIKALEDDPARCRAVLSTSAFRFQAVDDRALAGGCGLRNAVRIERMAMAVSSPFTLTCSAAVSLAFWERNVVQPAALRHFGQAAVRLEHLGSYACRNVYGREAAPRSQHATANALDVAGVVLQRGQRIRVATNWSRAGDPQGGMLFLQELRDGACDYFDVVLSPDYNAAHADHFHLDRGGQRICR